MESNTPESKNTREQVIKFNAKDFADKFLKLDDKKKEALKKAIKILNEEYGENSTNPTFESLFSEDFFEIINPEAAYDKDDKQWRESQIKHLSNYRQELLNTQDEESLNLAARNLADHMINL